MVAWYVDQFTERLYARQHAKPRMTAYQLIGLKFGIDQRYARKLTDHFRDQAAELEFASRMRALIKYSLLSIDADIDQLLARLRYIESIDKNDDSIGGFNWCASPEN